MIQKGANAGFGRVSLFLFFLCSALGAEKFLIEETSIPIRQIDLSPAVQSGVLYPAIDWEKLDFQKPSIITSNHLAYRLQNERVEVILLPAMGKIYALVDRFTGHNQLWTNPVARPIKAHNDTGWWMVWGGIECTVPRGEHGTTWSLPWSYSVAENSRLRKAVVMRVTEPATGLREELTVSIRPNSALVEADIRLTNLSSNNVPFAHWTNPMLAPGGRNELSPRTELVVPCSAMIVPDRDFTRWMGPKRQDFETNALRWIQNWRAPGDFLAETLTADFFGAFSHEANEGIVRIADRRSTPGMDIWAWGYPPPPERQREYTLAPNLGYVEMWGGTAKDYTDEARSILPPGATRQWREHFVSFSGTRGLSSADTNLIVSFRWSPKSKEVALGLFPVSPNRVKYAIKLDGKVFARESMLLVRPYFRSIKTEAGNPPELELILGRSDRVIRFRAKNTED